MAEGKRIAKLGTSRLSRLGQVDVLVLAAGESTRLAPLLKGMPKPLIDVKGTPVLGRNLRWLAAGGVGTVWINLHYRPGAILDSIGDGSAFGLRIHYSFEHQLLGTAGAARALSGMWRRPLLVVYGDSLVRFDLSAMWRAYQTRGGATIAAFDPARDAHTGLAGSRIQTSAAGRVQNFVETRGRAAGAGWVAAGVHLMEPDWIASLPPGPLDFGRDVFPAWLRQGKPLWAHPIQGYCLGLDTPETYQQALALIEENSLELS